MNPLDHITGTQDSELSAIFEQAYKDIPGVSRAVVHSLILRGVRYKSESHERLQERLDAKDARIKELESKLEKAYEEIARLGFLEDAP